MQSLILRPLWQAKSGKRPEHEQPEVVCDNLRRALRAPPLLRGGAGVSRHARQDKGRPGERLALAGFYSYFSRPSFLPRATGNPGGLGSCIRLGTPGDPGLLELGSGTEAGHCLASSVGYFSRFLVNVAQAFDVLIWAFLSCICQEYYARRGALAFPFRDMSKLFYARVGVSASLGIGCTLQ